MEHLDAPIIDLAVMGGSMDGWARVLQLHNHTTLWLPLLLAKTCQILSFAENPRWSPSVAIALPCLTLPETSNSMV